MKQGMIYVRPGTQTINPDEWEIRIKEFPIAQIGKIDKKELRSIIQEKLQKESRT